MNLIKKGLLLTGLLLTATIGYAQEDEDTQESNIQKYTPSKLIGKGQWDVKWFNNLYTQTKSANVDGDVTKNEDRATFFTSTLEVYTGVGENNRWNVGLILEARSNAIADRSALDVFKFDGENNTARSGLTSIAPSVKFVPFKSISNFSVQNSLFIPLVDNESENGVFLDQKGFTWQNRLFYDYTFPGNKWQLFTEFTTEYHFGDKEESFANNSLSINPGIFLSYFPSSKFTVLALVQHSSRADISDSIKQNFTAVGGGAKYQLSNALNLEVLYTNFVRGNNTGLGQTFNIGLRGIF